MLTSQLEQIKSNLIKEIEKRIIDKNIEPSNAELIVELINKSDTVKKAQAIAQLGTIYKKTGYHYDKKIEKIGSEIKYLSKNTELSFASENNGINHKLIIGDNYEALQNLLITHKKQIDVIYIDPPYGADSLGDFAKTNYTNRITRDNLLSMLEPRLKLAKQLMTNQGIIFLNIDDKNQAHIKLLMDDIFGEDNFIASIPRITSFQRSDQEKFMNISHDYVLVYSKKTDCDDFNKITERNVSKQIKQDHNGSYVDGDTKAILAAKSQGYSEGGDYDYIYNGKTYSPVDKNGVRNRWLWSKERMDAAAKLGILVETENTLRMRVYLDKRFEVGTNIIVPKKDGLRFHTADFMKEKFDNPLGTIELESILGKDKFSNPKPTSLIKALISFVDNEEAVVLDFFAGSGTTGQAVLELNKEDGGNRTFILCTNNETTEKTPNGIALDVTSKRLKRVMNGKCYDNSEDFKWLEKNIPLGGSLNVFDIKTVHNSEQRPKQSPLDVINEENYDLPVFRNIKDKIHWVCNNFDITQKRIIERD